MHKITDSERRKYAAMWSVDEYAANSPGAHYAEMFMRIAGPKPGAWVLDVGAGAGAGSVELKSRGLNVQAFDITDEAWKHEDIRLYTGCIWRDLNKQIRTTYDFIYCCDVMEHIPTEFTALSVKEMLKAGNRAFFTISFGPDNCGRFIGETLHMTVRPFQWWADMLREIGTLYEARDLLGDGVFLVGR